MPWNFPQALDRGGNSPIVSVAQGGVRDLCTESYPRQEIVPTALQSPQSWLVSRQVGWVSGHSSIPQSLPACYKTLGPACQRPVVIFLSVWAPAWEERGEVHAESLLNALSVPGLNSWEGT